MDKKPVNPCVRCGRERILLKTWKEKVKTFTGLIQIIVYSQTICPNKECQKIVDADIKNQEEKRETIRLKKEANEEARRLNSLSQANKARKNKSRI